MKETTTKLEKIWEPSQDRQSQSQMSKLMKEMEFSSYQELYQYSIQSPTHSSQEKNKGTFWRDLLQFYPVVYEGDPTIISTKNTFFDYTWFPDLKINFAENLLSQGKDDQIALSFETESGHVKKLSYKELRSEVAKFQDYIKNVIGVNDVVAAYMPNTAETVIAMLGTASLGGAFTSISCDFGVQSVLNRFEQTKPKVLVTTTAYEYNGKRHHLKDNIQEIMTSLKTLKKVIAIDFLNTDTTIEKVDVWEKTISKIKTKELKFVRVPFKSPLYIMYSSGTTGKPKCIVHSIGGTLLQHIKELGLHCDFNSNKTLFYFTTCAWMMWNWLISGLFFGGTICLFEGSPKFPSIKNFFNIINRHKVNIFGTSPKFLQILKESGYNKDLSLPTLETILSTGAPLSSDLFEFVYQNIKSDVMLSSIAGGTDILSCFILGNPLLPVYSGEITCRGLGMDVAVFDDKGKTIIEEQGELVCRQSFPSQPVLDIFKDDRENYRKAYFSVYPNIWRHGDQVRLSDRGTICIFGRSDATLNPGGVRIGTAEIYNVLEKFKDIEDSLCIGKTFDNDVKVLLFIKCQKYIFNEDLKKLICDQIKKRLTVRHVPSCIFQVDDIPYTRNGKKMEVFIRNLFEGHDSGNAQSISNPQCLNQYKKIFNTL